MTDKERIEGALRERINLALMEIARVASAAYNPAFRLTSAEFYEELRPILTRLVEQTRREARDKIDCLTEWNIGGDGPCVIKPEVEAILSTPPTPKEPEASGWVPVGERLPEYGQLVLVWVREDEYIDWARYTRHGWDFVEDSTEMNDLRGESVTHWRPLPPAPEGV
jgi:hypothetical protein